MKARTSGPDALDLIDHLGAIDHFAEYTVTPTVGIGRLEVQEFVVGNIDEELCGRRVWVGGCLLYTSRCV